ACKADIRAAELKDRTLPERACYGARERHLQPVENPSNAEGDHHKRMKRAPWQPVESGGDVRLDYGRPVCDGCSSTPSILNGHASCSQRGETRGWNVEQAGKFRFGCTAKRTFSRILRALWAPPTEHRALNDQHTQPMS